MVAKVELQFDDIFHICVLDCTQFGVLGLASFVCMSYLQQPFCPEQRASVLSAERWTAMQFNRHVVEVPSAVGEGKAGDNASLQEVELKWCARAVDLVQVLQHRSH
jgi:hypothetical protein